jgi:hypothetical protein
MPIQATRQLRSSVQQFSGPAANQTNRHKAPTKKPVEKIKQKIKDRITTQQFTKY